MAIFIFRFIFWHIIFFVVSGLPSIPFMGLLSWVIEGDKTIIKKILFFPIIAGSFLFGSLLPALFYSAGIFFVTAISMESSSYPIVYAIIGGISCLRLQPPRGQSSGIASLTSLISYICFMTFAKTYGAAITGISLIILTWALRLLIPIVIIGLVVAFISWVIAKTRKRTTRNEYEEKGNGWYNEEQS